MPEVSMRHACKAGAQPSEASPCFSSLPRLPRRWQAELSRSAPRQNSGKNVFKTQCHNISEKTL